MRQTVSIIGLGWYGMALAEVLIKAGCWVKGTKTDTRIIDNWDHPEIKAFHLELIPDLICSFPEKVFDAEVIVINIPPQRKMENAAEFYLSQMQSLIPYLQNGKVKKLLFISSTGVFGQVGKVDERSIPEARGPSSKALVNAEKLFLNTSGFKSIVLRPGGLIGPGREAGRFLSGKSGLKGSADPVNLVHLSDLISFSMHLIGNDYEQFIFHAVAEKHPSRMDFYTKAAEKLKLFPPRFDNAEADSETGKLVCSRLSRKVTGIEFKYEDPFEML